MTYQEAVEHAKNILEMTIDDDYPDVRDSLYIALADEGFSEEEICTILEESGF